MSVAKIICFQQETCADFSVGHKRKPHHVRITEPCIRLDDGTCPMLGTSCNVEKMQDMRTKFGIGEKNV